MEHPRERYYPHTADYLPLRLVARPFVTSIQKPLYRSTAVATDEFGLREQYGPGQVSFDLQSVASRFACYRVLAGGSAAFGIGASSDRTTIAAFLSRDGPPCINLGIRGGTSQTELAVFLAFRHLLPRVTDLVLLTGVNECILAGLGSTAVHAEFGGTFLDSPSASSGRGGRRSRTVGVAGFQRSQAERRLSLLLDRAVNNLAIWQVMEEGFGLRVHLVLQPVAGWAAKRLTPMERHCLDGDLRSDSSIGWLVDSSIYHLVRRELSFGAGEFGIRFYDANDWFGQPDHDAETLFIDLCHFNDSGHRVLADALAQRLDWSAP